MSRRVQVAIFLSRTLLRLFVLARVENQASPKTPNISHWKKSMITSATPSTFSDPEMYGKKPLVGRCHSAELPFAKDDLLLFPFKRASSTVDTVAIEGHRMPIVVLRKT